MIGINYEGRSIVLLTNLDALLQMSKGIFTQEERDIIRAVHSEVSDRVDNGIYGDELQAYDRDYLINKILENNKD